MDFIESTARTIREAAPAHWALTNLGLDLRSCGCRIIRADWQGLDTSSWEEAGAPVVNAIDREVFPWDVVYLGLFPGTDLVRRVTFRKFCPHCLSNYRLDGSPGMNSRVVEDHTKKPTGKVEAEGQG